MTTTSKTLILILVVVMLATLSFGVIAHGHGGTRLASLFSHGGQHGCNHPTLGGVVRQLNLTEKQQGHVQAMHKVAGAHREVLSEAHTALHGALVAAVASGSVDEQELQRIVDSSLEEMRQIAYSMASEVTGLVNSLDESQRAVLNAHIEAFHAAAESGGEERFWGHGDGGGHSD